MKRIKLQNAYYFLQNLIKDFSIKTDLLSTSLFDRYHYMYDPDQLVVLTKCLDEVADVSGCVIEAGCAFGDTTVFLAKYLERRAQDRNYYAIDTFAGFVLEHVNHEIERRFKDDQVQRAKFKESFIKNKQAWFDKSMQISGTGHVKSIQADVATFDFGSLGPIAFCLLDVDLYLPIKQSLVPIYEALSPGGIIVVDDCEAGHIFWDGAEQAYNEFVKEYGLETCILAGKLGIIRKPI